MGLLESSYRLIFRADTSQAREEIKLLSGEEKSAAEAQLKNLNQINKAVESQSKMFDDLKTVMSGITGAFKTGMDLIEFAGRRADLASAAAGVSLDQLREATFGTRTETELLATAAKLNHSIFQLTQEDMNTAAKAMTALGERGGNAQEAIDAVTEALVTGKTKGLKQYGIEVDETKSKSEKLKDMMRQLAGVAGEVSASSFDASDKVGMMKVGFVNAVDHIKESIGKLATSLGPLLTLLAKAVELAADIVDSATYMTRFAKDAIEAKDRKSYGEYGKGAAAGGYALSALDVLLKVEKLLNGHDDIIFDPDNSYAAHKAALEKDWKNPSTAEHRARIAADIAKAGLVHKDPRMEYGDAGEYSNEYSRQRYYKSIGAGSDAGGYGVVAEQQALRDDKGDLTTQTALNQQALTDKLTKNWFDLSAKLGATGKQPTITEQMFGKVEEINGYNVAFSALTATTTSAYGALVDGTMSAGQAAKAALKDALKGLGSRMLVRGIEETAEGFAALANPFAAVSAASHFKSAALFGAGAVAAGLVASQIGGGGGSTASSGGGSRPSAPSVGGSGSGSAAPSTPIIVYADQFADDSPRGRQLQADKLVNRVRNMNTAVQHS